MEEMVYSPKRTNKVLTEGIYEGRLFAIVSYGTHPCAYVEFPSDLQKKWKMTRKRAAFEDKLEEKIWPHGGITYYGYLDHIEGHSKDVEYFGWDYSHGGDYNAYYLNYGTKSLLQQDGKKWTTGEILLEVEAIIDELNKLMDK